MAARKPMMGPKPERQDLTDKVAASLATPLTPADYEEQRISFAYGNAPYSDRISKESVRRAASTYRLSGDV